MPADRNYARVSQKLDAYAPWFDGCIGAIDGTHIKVEVNHEAKVDFYNRKGETTINVCAIVDMDGRFTYVGAGKVGACHDMAVLKDFQATLRSHIPQQVRDALMFTFLNCLLVVDVLKHTSVQFAMTADAYILSP